MAIYYDLYFILFLTRYYDLYENSTFMF